MARTTADSAFGLGSLRFGSGCRTYDRGPPQHHKRHHALASLCTYHGVYSGAIAVELCPYTARFWTLARLEVLLGNRVLALVTANAFVRAEVLC